MNKLSRVLGSLSILVITQSFAADMGEASSQQPPKVDLSGISKDQLKNKNELAKVEELLKKFVLQRTRQLAELQFYEKRSLSKEQIFVELKHLLVQRGEKTLSALKDLSHVYEYIQNTNKFANASHLLKMAKNIEASAETLYRSIISLNSVAKMIDESVSEDFLAFYEKLQQTQNQMANYFGGMKLADVAKNVLQEPAKKDKNSRIEELKKMGLHPELSLLFGKFFLPLKEWDKNIAKKLEHCKQSILRGENVDDKLTEIELSQIEPDFMRAQYLKMAAHVGQMLLSLYHIQPYEEEASAFSGQQKDIDSYFEHVQKYVEQVYLFQILLNSSKKILQDLQKDVMDSSVENYFVVIDVKKTYNRRDVVFKSWLGSFGFSYNLNALFNVIFEEIDTDRAKMIISCEKWENGRVYHNDIFDISIKSLDTTRRAATETELFVFNTIAALASAEGHLLIIDPADHKRVWTIRGTESISVRFDMKEEMTWWDKNPRACTGLFSEKKDE